MNYYLKEIRVKNNLEKWDLDSEEDVPPILSLFLSFFSDV